MSLPLLSDVKKNHRVHHNNMGNGGVKQKTRNNEITSAMQRQQQRQRQRQQSLQQQRRQEQHKHEQLQQQHDETIASSSLSSPPLSCTGTGLLVRGIVVCCIMALSTIQKSYFDRSVSMQSGTAEEFWREQLIHEQLSPEILNGRVSSSSSLSSSSHEVQVVNNNDNSNKNSFEQVSNARRLDWDDIARQKQEAQQQHLQASEIRNRSSLQQQQQRQQQVTNHLHSKEQPLSKNNDNNFHVQHVFVGNVESADEDVVTINDNDGTSSFTDNHNINNGGDDDDRVVSFVTGAENPLQWYRSLAEMEARAERFPSAQDRVKHYMASWYLPPCNANDRIGFALELHSNSNNNMNNQYVNENPTEQWLADFPKSKSRPFLLVREIDAAPLIDDEHQLPHLQSSRRIFRLETTERLGPQVFYVGRNSPELCKEDNCRDIVRFVHPVLDQLIVDHQPDNDHTELEFIPTLMQTGDHEITSAPLATDPPPKPGRINVITSKQLYPNIPLLKKFRHALRREDITTVTTTTTSATTAATTALTNGTTTTASTMCLDGPRPIPPNQKHKHRLQPIVWLIKYDRHYGYMNTVLPKDIPWEQKKNQAVFRGGFTGFTNNDIHRDQMVYLTDEERCINVPRCRLVFSTANSTLVDAKMIQRNGKNYGMNSHIVDGVEIFGDELKVSQMMRYKALIMIEGHDVSSGLKWGLLSNSVIMAPNFIFASWAMEDLLEPWVHYIPIEQDLTDVEEKMQWVVENDHEANEIAHNGKLWMLDMMFHPDAMKDQTYIFDEILRRYRAHFTFDPQLIQQVQQISAKK